MATHGRMDPAGSFQRHSLRTEWGEPDLLDPATDIAAWFTDPPGVVTQLGIRTHIDSGMARYLMHRVHRAVRAKFREKTYALHDWTCAESFDLEARGLLIRFCIDHRSDFIDTGVAHPPLTPLWRMATAIGKKALDVGGVPFQLFPTIEEGIARLKLRRAFRR